jgi:hypothetical protein
VNEKSDTIGSAAPPVEAASAGVPGRKTGDLDAFKNPEGPGAASPGRGPSLGGKKSGAKNKGGRPPKNAAGFSAEKIDQVADDPEIEAARLEFEGVLIELLVSTTDNLADARYEILKAKFPDDVARGVANKAKLTDKEKKFFGGLAVRLWRKYLGDKYLFSDEAIAGIYLLQYCLRNIEGVKQARAIEKEIASGKPNDQQSGLPGPPNSRNGNHADGKDDPGRPARSLTPGPSGPGV